MAAEVPVVVYDASVLFPFQTAHILTFTAQAGLVDAYWSADIEREWVERAIAKAAGSDRRSIEARRDAMNRALPGARAVGYESLVPTIAFADPDDRHVVAAAIACGARIIVTRDRHFTAASLAPFALAAIDPDALLGCLLSCVPDLMLEVVDAARRALSRSRPSPEAYLEILAGAGLPSFAAALRAHRP
ncbi:PIN domain-containing protein [Salinarimonas rosea]|uniref:PIN domain-containing protein n=1 Tax=Salinarimonas rosea TaxID=552063 RepID=UPI0004275B49|nr:PIN domain-containing protein [Salinarimonas rosea]